MILEEGWYRKQNADEKKATDKVVVPAARRRLPLPLREHEEEASAALCVPAYLERRKPADYDEEETKPPRVHVPGLAPGRSPQVTGFSGKRIAPLYWRPLSIWIQTELTGDRRIRAYW
jgi:hypothetical protein